MTEAQFDVLGIGNAIVDVLSQESEDFIAEHQLNRGAMTLIEEDRARTLYDAMGVVTEISGGSAANTLAGVASFGGKAAFVGKVRDDQLGDIFTHNIRAGGVHFETPQATDGPQTACCLVIVSGDGERTMNTYLGAAQGLSPDDINPDLVAASKVTYMEGYLWDPPLAKEAFLKAAAIAHDAGQKVSLSLSDPFCVDRYRDEFLDLIENEVDILFGNRDEILSLYQTESFETAIAALRGKCDIAAITRSEAGSVVLSGDQLLEIPAAPVQTVVDSTGAGDQYAAGFLFGWSQGYDLTKCGLLASAAAAEVIQHLGARPEQSYREFLG